MNEDNPALARPIPLGAVGPGTQPDASAPAALDYLSMPGAMRTYRPPLLPEPEAVAGLTQGLGLLRSLQQLLNGYRIGAPPQVFDLGALDAANRHLVEDSLGEGEVSILQSTADPDAGQARAQETRLAGVWRVRVVDRAGSVRRDVLEIADLPAFVRASAFDDACDAAVVADLQAGPLPDGVMNAPGVLAELNARVAARARDRAAPVQIINLTLLPLTGQDLVLLTQRLGVGSIRMLSRGYGNCRITATALREVWWVQLFNSDDRLILNTLEVTGVPEAALAAQEDIDDSAARLREILEALA